MVWPNPKKFRRLMPNEKRGLKPVTPAGESSDVVPPPMRPISAPTPTFMEYRPASSSE